MSTGGHELAESNKSLEDKAQSSNHAFASPNPPVEVPDHENWKPSLRVKFIITTLACTSFIIAVGLHVALGLLRDGLTLTVCLGRCNDSRPGSAC